MDQELNRVANSKLKTAFNPKKRQTVMSGRKGKNYADFIEAGSGLAATAVANTTDPIIATFANGFDLNGQLDYINRITTDISYTGLEANATSYLGIERVDSNSVTAIKTTTRPIYDSVFGSDRENKACATFDGTLAATTFTDFYGNQFRMYNGAAIAVGHPSGAGNSLRLGGDYAEVDLSANRINLNTLQTWTIEFWFKLDTVNTGASQALISSNTIHMINLYKAASNATDLILNVGDGNVSFISGATFTVGTLSNNTWYHIAIVYEGRNYKVYRDGALRYSSGIIAFDFNIGNISKLFLGKLYNNGSWTTGNISNFAIWPYVKYSGANNTYTTSVFSPSTANLTADIVKEDRYFRANDRFLINFESASVNTSTLRETYGNEVIFVHNGSATDQPFIQSLTGPTGFGTVKTLNNSVAASTYNRIELRNIIFPKKWTIECFFRATTLSTAGIIEFRNDNTGFSGGTIYIEGTSLKVNLSSNGSSGNIASTIETHLFLSANTWYHLAISYDGLNYRIFLNGWIFVIPSILPIFQPNKISFGGNDGASVNAFRGNIFLPIMTPYAKYTSSFTPMTSYPTPEDIYYYDIDKAKMYKGYTGNFTETPTVFLGEAETNSNSVIRTTAYSLNGEIHLDEVDAYGSGIISTGSTNLTKNTMPHYIGTDRINVDYWCRRIRGNTSGSIVTANSRFKPLAYANPYTGNPIVVDNHNYFSLQMGVNGWLCADDQGVAFAIVPSDPFKWEFKIERDF